MCYSLIELIIDVCGSVLPELCCGSLGPEGVVVDYLSRTVTSDSSISIANGDAYDPVIMHSILLATLMK